MTADSIPAGDLAAWLGEMTGALRGVGISDVPCGSCTACCRSSQFVHIAPDERETLAVIPKELLFPAPRLPTGHALLGYDEHGRCPMLVDGGCSIYDNRPRACRVYDCRVFAATGVTPSDKPAVAERVRQWRFSFDHPDSQAISDALQAAAAALSRLTGDLAPTTATGQAVVAVQIVDLFLQRDARGTLSVVEPPLEQLRNALARLARARDTGSS